MNSSLSIGAMLHPKPETVRADFLNARDLELSHFQIGYDAALDNPAGIHLLGELAKETGIEITTVFCGFAGENYADIPTVRRTVGLVPSATRAERLAKIREISRFAAVLGVLRVGAHIGYIPASKEAGFDELVQVVQQICDEFAGDQQVFSLETGQETAAGLRDFLESVARPNLRVNFDPANMILYGNDEPRAALDILFPWIDGVHCKDGKWPTQADQLGEETPLGEGDVQFSEWLSKLVALGYSGPFTIEREISGPRQREDIARGRDLIRAVLAA